MSAFLSHSLFVSQNVKKMHCDFCVDWMVNRRFKSIWIPGGYIAKYGGGYLREALYMYVYTVKYRNKVLLIMTKEILNLEIHCVHGVFRVGWILAISREPQQLQEWMTKAPDHTQSSLLFWLRLRYGLSVLMYVAHLSPVYKKDCVSAAVTH